MPLNNCSSIRVIHVKHVRTYERPSRRGQRDSKARELPELRLRVHRKTKTQSTTLWALQANSMVNASERTNKIIG